MKKIIFAIVVVMCLTACGNEEIFEDKIQNEEDAVDISDEDNIVMEEKIDVNENVGGKIVPEENKVIEKTDMNVVEKIEEKDMKIVEEENDQTDSKGKFFEEKIVYDEGVEVGKKAIDFEVELLSGEKVKLSDYLGKPIFLNFWATWCGPCVGEMPDIEKIKNEYGDKIVVIAINGGELKDDVKSFIDRKGYTFNVGIDEKGSIIGTYDSMYIPLSIFIDENGIIQDRQVGALSEEKMREIVDKLIEAIKNNN